MNSPGPQVSRSVPCGHAILHELDKAQTTVHVPSHRTLQVFALTHRAVEPSPITAAQFETLMH